MAVSTREPTEGLIHHSDRGSQYTSLGFGQRLKQAGILPSMGSRGDAYDNAMAESFVATLKRESIHRQSWPTRAAARSAIFEYIEVYYNRSRLHSSLGYLTPEQFEKGGTMTKAIAAYRLLVRQTGVIPLLVATGQNLKRLLSWRGWGRRPFPGGAIGMRLALPSGQPQPI